MDEKYIRPFFLLILFTDNIYIILISIIICVKIMSTILLKNIKLTKQGSGWAFHVPDAVVVSNSMLGVVYPLIEIHQPEIDK
jgi:hypothetical protein